MVHSERKSYGTRESFLPTARDRASDYPSMMETSCRRRHLPQDLKRLQCRLIRVATSLSDVSLIVHSENAAGFWKRETELFLTNRARQPAGRGRNLMRQLCKEIRSACAERGKKRLHRDRKAANHRVTFAEHAEGAEAAGLGEKHIASFPHKKKKLVRRRRGHGAGSWLETFISGREGSFSDFEAFRGDARFSKSQVETSGEEADHRARGKNAGDASSGGEKNHSAASPTDKSGVKLPWLWGGERSAWREGVWGKGREKEEGLQGDHTRVKTPYHYEVGRQKRRVNVAFFERWKRTIWRLRSRRPMRGTLDSRPEPRPTPKSWAEQKGTQESEPRM